MKKKTYLVVLALCTALAITACGTSADTKGETKIYSRNTGYSR